MKIKFDKGEPYGILHHPLQDRALNKLREAHALIAEASGLLDQLRHTKLSTCPGLCHNLCSTLQSLIAGIDDEAIDPSIDSI